MRIVLIATLTADGFIAKDSHHLVDWSSKSDKATFVRVTKELGTMVMGANTFATIGRALPGRRSIVLTHHPERITAEGVETTQESAIELISRLEAEGVPGLAVCGGAQVYTQFMQSGLVQELYLVTEAYLMGQGITLFQEPISDKIELVESNVVGHGSVVNHFRVLKT